MSEPEPHPESPRARLRWFQIRLRTLLAIMLLIAAGLSWRGATIQHAKRQWRAAAILRGAGVIVGVEQIWLGRILGDYSLVNVTSIAFDSRSPATDGWYARLHGVDLRQLKQLSLGGRLHESAVTDVALEHLQGLIQLRTLDLRNTAVTDSGLLHLQELGQLRHLSLGQTSISDVGLLYLRGLCRLQLLDLDKTAVSDAGLVHLQRLSQLQKLTLDDTRITDAGLVYLARLSQLQVLRLNETQVTDAGLVHLTRLSNLRFLFLTGTKITTEGVKNIQRSLPNCKIGLSLGYSVEMKDGQHLQPAKSPHPCGERLPRGADRGSMVKFNRD